MARSPDRTERVNSENKSAIVNRRKFIQTSGFAGMAAVAGCLGVTDEDDDEDPRELELDPDEEYDEVDTIDHVGISSDISTLRAETQSQVVGYMEELGLDWDLTPGGWGVIGEAQESGDFDFYTMWWVGRPTRLDPHFMTWANFHSDDPGNYIGYANDEYDALVDEALEEYDFDQRQELVFEIQEILANDQPVVFIYHIDQLAAANQAIYSGWAPKIGAQTYWNIDNLRSLSPETDADTVVFGTTIDINTLNPHGAGVGDRNIQQQKMMYEQLTHWTREGENELRAASDIEIVDDTTIDVEIRDDLTWHDGEALTGEDVEFTYNWVVDHAEPYYQTFIDPIEGAELLDEYAVRIHLDRAFAPLRDVTFSQIAILPAHIWDGMLEEEGIDRPEDWEDPDHTGAGPFEVVDFQIGERVMYEVHEDHPWADEFEFETLIWQIYGSEAAAFGDLEGGEASFMQEIQFTNFERAEADENLIAEDSPGIGATAVWPNMQREPMNDVMFRRALAHAIDQQEIINLVNHGLGDVAVTPISPANEEWYNPELPSYDGGLDEARQILADAGYRWDDGDLLKPVSRFEGDGPPRFSHEL